MQKYIYRSKTIDLDKPLFQLSSLARESIASYYNWKKNHNVQIANLTVLSVLSVLQRATHCQTYSFNLSTNSWIASGMPGHCLAWMKLEAKTILRGNQLRRTESIEVKRLHASIMCIYLKHFHPSLQLLTLALSLHVYQMIGT